MYTDTVMAFGTPWVQRVGCFPFGNEWTIYTGLINYFFSIYVMHNCCRVYIGAEMAINQQ